MSKARAFSSPELAPPSINHHEMPEDYCLEGVATNVKLLLKLIQDHNEACTKDNDNRKLQRVAGMIAIIDDVKTRVEKFQSSGKKRELRRCNTDLRPNVPRDKKSPDPITDEKERLRRELNSSLAAQKSLEVMCSSLGKEKEIIASELARKVQEFDGMEELINDLKVQNEMLLGKVQAYAEEHRGKKCGGGEGQGNVTLQERNKALSEKLLRSLDGYRSLKRRFRDAKEENIAIFETMEEMGMEVQAGLDRICSFKQRMASGNEQPVDFEEEISAIEHMFEGFDMKISKHGHKKSECVKPKAEINASKPSVVA
ncbi:myosin heavy chain, striated muscle [Fagus crenata]|uniref:Uncharacterized protein n=1 Tax=Fagus sylvatica TaxID=28930 RepID=A0A2N9GAY8_FAGSY